MQDDKPASLCQYNCQDSSALLGQLAATGMAPQWNFSKCVISRDGKAVSAFKAARAAGSRPFIAQTKAQLARR